MSSLTPGVAGNQCPACTQARSVSSDTAPESAGRTVPGGSFKDIQQLHRVGVYARGPAEPAPLSPDPPEGQAVGLGLSWSWVAAQTGVRLGRHLVGLAVESALLFMHLRALCVLCVVLQVTEPLRSHTKLVACSLSPFLRPEGQSPVKDLLLPVHRPFPGEKCPGALANARSSCAGRRLQPGLCLCSCYKEVSIQHVPGAQGARSCEPSRLARCVFMSSFSPCAPCCPAESWTGSLRLIHLATSASMEHQA